MQMSTQFLVEPREKLRYLFLCDRRREINIPDSKAGKRLRVPREQAVQERGTTAQVSQNKKRLFDRLCFIGGKKNIIQEETEPMDERADGPNGIEHQEE